jgi:hypothetical protein
LQSKDLDGAQQALSSLQQQQQARGHHRHHHGGISQSQNSTDADGIGDIGYGDEPTGGLEGVINDARHSSSSRRDESSRAAQSAAVFANNDQIWAAVVCKGQLRQNPGYVPAKRWAAQDLFVSMKSIDKNYSRRNEVKIMRKHHIHVPSPCMNSGFSPVGNIRRCTRRKPSLRIFEFRLFSRGRLPLSCGQLLVLVPT